jgi:predicted nucleotidyltransferase
MTALAGASLSEAERRALERSVLELQREFGERLRSVWLYGSRARGETPHPESDIDLLVVLDHRNWEEDGRVFDAVRRAAEEAGVNSLFFMPLVYDVEAIAQRREIESFFIREVDRDKIVLFGEP